MISTLINLAIVTVILLFLDFFVESKFHIRKRIVIKIGVIVTIILTILVVILIDFILVNYWPELDNNELYKYAKIGFIIYFLPRKGDKS